MGRYEFQKKLGGGGMGVTYLALKRGVEGFQRQVVVKKLHPQFGNVELMESLIAEARLLALLHHPYLALVYDLVREEDEVYIEMEYVDGIDMATLLRRHERLAPDVLFYLLCRVLQALDYVHNATDQEGRSLRIVHRDVSPDNILLSKDGYVKLADFGLAKIRNSLQKTTPGVLKGKFAYMAPEQARGEKLDHRVDLFAVGVMLFEGLCGVRPFQGNSHAGTLHKVALGVLPPLESYLPDLDPQLERIIRKSLHPDRDQRYQDARSFFRDLLTFITPVTLEELGWKVQGLVRSLNGNRSTAPARASTSKSSVQISGPHRQVLYVLGQDKVFDASFREKLTNSAPINRCYEIAILDSREDLTNALDQLRSFERVPSVVLFGGLQVAMSHPFLEELRDFQEICKVLVMDHVSSDLLAMAINLCGLQLFFETPVAFGELETTLDQKFQLRTFRDRLLYMFKEQSAFGNEMQSRIDALAQANVRAVQLLEEVQRKNQFIEEQNLFLQRVARTVVAPQQQPSSFQGAIFFQGDLLELNLLDLLQLLSMSRKTAQVTLNNEDHHAHVSFEDGQICDARLFSANTYDALEIVGESAVRILLGWERGSFTVHAHRGELERTISRRTDQLLLDLLRERDEKSRLSAEFQWPEGDAF